MLGQQLVAMLEVVATFLRREFVQNATAQGPESIDGAFGTVAEQFLQLRERQSDWVEVGCEQAGV